MNHFIKLLNKAYGKFTFKQWNIYILKKEVYNFFLHKPSFTLNDIKQYILIKIAAPNSGHIIAADPFFHDEDNLLYESISKITGNGQIYKFNLLENKNNRVLLPIHKHFSFPRTIELNGITYLTLEASDSKGLCVFETNKEISFIKETANKINSEDYNYHIVDPIISKLGGKIILYCTTLEYGNKKLLFFESDLRKLFNFKLIKILPISKSTKEIHTLRLAGQISYKNKINLCSQNFSTCYGSSLNILNLNHDELIKANNIDEYSFINNINCKNLLGPHTINSSPNSMIAIDLASQSLFYLPLKIYHYFYKIIIRKFIKISIYYFYKILNHLKFLLNINL